MGSRNCTPPPPPRHERYVAHALAGRVAIRPPLLPRECVRTAPGPWVPRGERATVPAGARGRL